VGPRDPFPDDATAVAALKRAAIAEVDRHAELLLDVSHDIWEHPELCFEEHHAHDVLCDALEAGGLTPTRHAYGLDTAFEASAGNEGALVGVMCEYDALPGIGHACGHNIIAAAGWAPAWRRPPWPPRRAPGAHPRHPGRGGGGGKVLMLRRAPSRASTRR